MNLVPYMEQWNMFPPEGGTMICAVSGGRDSMCLLHYLCFLSKEKNFTVVAAHLNHMMRTTAERDQEFVRSFCEQLQIPFYMEYGDVYGKAKEWNCSTEESGRRLRYEFLEKLSRDLGAQRIATAHHLGDQAETVLLNLVRGTGPDGLAGIPPVRGKLIRPLLHTSRQEMEAYNQENGIHNVEDETNTNLDFARNRLRLIIWPELEKINENLQGNILRASEIVQKENSFLNELALRCLPKEGTTVDAKSLLSQNEVIQARAIRILLSRLPSGKKDVGTVHIEQLLKLLHDGGTLHLPGNMQAVCRKGIFNITMKQEVPKETELREGDNIWGAYVIHMERGEGGELQCSEGDLPLRVRTWNSHDRMKTTDNPGARSLKRLFVDHAIPQEVRDLLPVIVSGEQILGVYGIGPNETRITPIAGDKIAITIKKEEDR